MKVLWLCLFLPEQVANKLNIKESVKEGWITGALDRMVEDSDVSLAIAHPVISELEETKEEIMLTEKFSVTCFRFREDTLHPERYDSSMEIRLHRIVSEFDPDVIHVFGTEYGHTLAMTNVISRLEEAGKSPRLLVGLQGIIYRCGEEYECGLSRDIVNRNTFRDIIKRDNIRCAKAKFISRGENEKKALSKVKHVTGRTRFDRDCAISLNPDVVYHHMNETLRAPFYSGAWNLADCRRHSIFVSQGDYPLKGLHIVLAAMPAIMRKYPDATLTVAGNNITAFDSFKDKLRLSSYGKYIRELISSNNLWDHVHFTGRLGSEVIKAKYLECHTYVCASSIENSPNSMGEAMLLGVPVVAPDTGGIPSMLDNGKEGLLFPAMDSEKLADCIIRLWSDDALAMEMGAHAMARATKTHDADANYKRLMEIYEELCE